MKVRVSPERLALESGDTLYYLGEKRALTVIREERTRAKVKCIMGRLIMWVPYDADYFYKREQLEKWYRKEAAAVFAGKALEYAARLRV
ncbi:MAG: M48 family metallopeptidase, partial [Lachnospiraceae bacterium]|nr:M48 family metallopeptidase [Lachnospiraceae bacterium]